MPIIELLQNQNAPLSQGDILKGVSLFETHNPWEKEGGKEKKTRHLLCLVLSRPCIGTHRDRVIVAAIEEYKKKSLPELDNFETVQDFYKTIRDGHASPDQFYLGQVPEKSGSFCARLDSLHTIRIPTDKVERAAFVTACRIGTLNIDFVRDLHVRIFHAFSSLGFDDHKWFTTDDLRTVVMVADRDAAHLQADLLEKQTKLQAGNTQGFAHESEKRKLEKEQEDIQKKLDKLKIEVEPFRAELERRAGQ